MKSKRRVSLLLPSFVPHDAIGNDVRGMARALGAAGYQVRILSGHVNEAYRDSAGLLKSDSECWNSPDDIMIYHHSIGWQTGEAVLNCTRNKVAIKYHNVTPPQFFVKYARHYYDACAQGEIATRRVAKHPSAMFWGASWFNAEALISLGAPRERCRSLAPCHLTEEWKEVPMDVSTLGAYRDGRWNILFVGGMKPNKGHARALQVFAAYRKIYNPMTRLIFAGNYDPGLAAYADEMRTLTRRLGVESDVVFENEVSPSQLKALYYAADVFLCVSEHEGFCVPLVEAMALRVPILASAHTAIPETVGDGGIVRQDFDPVEFADALENLRRDPEQRNRVVELGRQRYENEFHPDVIDRRLLKLVAELEEDRHV